MANVHQTQDDVTRDLSKRHQEVMAENAITRAREIDARRRQRVKEALDVSKLSSLHKSHEDDDAVNSPGVRRESMAGQIMAKAAASSALDTNSQLYQELYGDGLVIPGTPTRGVSSVYELSGEMRKETTHGLEQQLEDQREACAELKQELARKSTKIAQLEQERAEAHNREVESETKEEAASWKERNERLKDIIQRSEDEKSDLRRQLREAEDNVDILEGQLQKAERNLQKARDDLAEQTERVEEEMAQRRLVKTGLNSHTTTERIATPSAGHFERERARVDRRVSPTYSGGDQHHSDERYYQSSQISVGSGRNGLLSDDQPLARAPTTYTSASRAPSTRTHAIVRSRTGGVFLRTLF